MSLSLNIPESIVNSLHLPENELEQRLRTELAIALYAQNLLSFGAAAEWSGADRIHFADLVAQRGIPRHYGDAELAEDLAYANGE